MVLRGGRPSRGYSLSAYPSPSTFPLHGSQVRFNHNPIPRVQSFACDSRIDRHATAPGATLSSATFSAQTVRGYIV